MKNKQTEVMIINALCKNVKKSDQIASIKDRHHHQKCSQYSEPPHDQNGCCMYSFEGGNKVFFPDSE